MILEEVGLGKVVEKVRDSVEGLAREIYPALVGPSGLDSAKAFTVEYDAEEEANDKEVDQCISNAVFKIVRRNGVPITRIMAMRWILTWKEVAGGTNTKITTSPQGTKITTPPQGAKTTGSSQRPDQQGHREGVWSHNNGTRDPSADDSALTPDDYECPGVLADSAARVTTCVIYSSYRSCYYNNCFNRAILHFKLFIVLPVFN